MSTEKATPLTDWLDEQNFYEACQIYRHANQHGNGTPTDATAAFEALKTYIRAHVSATPMTDLYLKLGQAQREVEFLRGVIARSDETIADLRASLRLRDVEIARLNAVMRNPAPAPAMYRTDNETSTDGRKLR